MLHQLIDEAERLGEVAPGEGINVMSLVVALGINAGRRLLIESGSRPPEGA